MGNFHTIHVLLSSAKAIREEYQSEFLGSRDSEENEEAWLNRELSHD